MTSSMALIVQLLILRAHEVRGLSYDLYAEDSQHSNTGDPS